LDFEAGRASLVRTLPFSEKNKKTKNNKNTLVLTLTLLSGNLTVIERISASCRDPYVRQSIEKMAWEMMPAILEENEPSWIHDLSLKKFELGKKEPDIKRIHVFSGECISSFKWFK
jgi:hypothetical protein